MIAALIDAFGVTANVVHIDYNNILHADDARFYREMTASVLGAAKRYSLPSSVMFDSKPGTGGIRTTLDQPYARDDGVFDAEVRYFD